MILKLTKNKFATQILYRGEGKEMVLGWIAEFPGKGITVKYKKTDPNHMHGGFIHNYKCTINGRTWSKEWTTYSGAIRELLRLHDKDTMLGTSRVVQYPQTFKKQWKELEHNEIYNPGDELVQEEESDS